MPGHADYRALVCITTCDRLHHLERYLPHFARACHRDPRLSLIVSLDGADPATRSFCGRWEVPLVHSDEREGVGLSKNRVLARFPDFDYYFFIEDDTELADGSVFAQHVSAARASGIHHFSLFDPDELKKRTHVSALSGWRIAHGLYGGARFSFFTAEALRRVGGWHPGFAAFRRWGHTEHSYRVFRAGLAPAPFNVIDGLQATCIWHFRPPGARDPDMPVDTDGIAAPERQLMDQHLTQVPVETLSPHHFNGVPFDRLGRMVAALEEGTRYPLVSGWERREARADYSMWRFENEPRIKRRAAALLVALANRPSAVRPGRST
ncbi:MAG: glycosyltransferase family 2 protein [Solirubrobacteraceae bacterium]